MNCLMKTIEILFQRKEVSKITDYQPGDIVQITKHDKIIKAGVIDKVLIGNQNQNPYIKFVGSDYLHEINESKTIIAM